MNILIDRLPDSVIVEENPYPINTDFRVWVKFENLMLDNNISIEHKAMKLLPLCYKRLPPTLDGAIMAMVDFYTGENTKPGKGGGNTRKPIYSFEYDAEYIYAAFLGQYGIDLQQAQLHWWQFKALFKSLNDANQIIKIMEYRSVELGKIKDREQKAFYRKMKAMYNLPDPRSEEEKERAMINSLAGLF